MKRNNRIFEVKVNLKDCINYGSIALPASSLRLKMAWPKDPLAEMTIPSSKILLIISCK